MTGRRLRLNDNERAYLLRLIAEDNRFHEEMVSKSIIKLIAKLNDKEQS